MTQPRTTNPDIRKCRRCAFFRRNCVRTLDFKWLCLSCLRNELKIMNSIRRK